MPEHSHCKYCGDPVPFGQEYCDEECRRAETERVAAEKRKENLFWLTAVVAVIVVIAAGYLLG